MALPSVRNGAAQSVKNCEMLKSRGSFYILKEEKIGKMIVDLDMSGL